MGDYAGYLRHCFTPLVAYIADTPEAGALTGVAGKTSHLTTASYKEFSDSFRHPPRMASDVLASLSILSHYFDPSNVRVYANKARELYRLNGVNLSFWLSRTGIFHVLFALFFFTLTNTILQILSYHTRFKPFRLLTRFTDNKKTRVLNP